MSQNKSLKFWRDELPKKSQERLGSIPYLKLVLISLAINLATIVSVLLLQKTLPPEIPLFYGRPRGEEQLASSLALIIPNAIALATISINLAISAILEDNFLKKALVLTGTIAVFLSTITTIKIFLLVGSF